MSEPTAARDAEPTVTIERETLLDKIHAQRCQNNPCTFRVRSTDEVVTSGSCHCLDGLSPERRRAVSAALRYIKQAVAPAPPDRAAEFIAPASSNIQITDMIVAVTNPCVTAPAPPDRAAVEAALDAYERAVRSDMGAPMFSVSGAYGSDEVEANVRAKAMQVKNETCQTLLALIFPSDAR